MMKTKHLVMTVLVAALTTFGTMFALNRYFPAGNDTAAQTGSPFHLADYKFPVAPDGMAPVDFTFAAALTTPAVVHVKTSFTQTAAAGGQDIFRQFFGDDFNWDYGSRQAQATGSGVIVSADGYIVTNYHVVKNADDIEVVLFDKQKMKATLVGTDPSTDVALLKVDGKDMPTIQYGNSDSVRVGEWVLAVGNPFDLTSTVTAGIVSAKGRKIDILGENASTPVESFIQTDAAVNPGNSGGALVNTEGRLIGINTAIATPTGTFAGYSFAVPVNIVQKVVRDLKKYGTVQRAYLGVEIDITKDDLGGVRVASVVDGSGADAAGIKEGDIITHINKAPITSFPELQEQVSQYDPGDKVNVDLVRGDDHKNIVVTLKNKEGNTNILIKETNDVVESLGIRYEDLSDREAQYYQLDGGVRLTEIHSGKISAQTRIREGFIITGLDGESVKNGNELARKLKNKSGENVIVEGIYPAYPNKIYNYGISL